MDLVRLLRSDDVGTGTGSARRLLGGAPALVVPAVAIGVAAAVQPETTLGVALVGFWVLVFGKRLHDGIRRSLVEPWLVRIAFAGLFVRIPVVLAHLAVGLLIFGGRVDFAVYAETASRFGRQILVGDFAFFDLPFSSPNDFGWALLDRILGVSYILIGPSLVSMFLLSAVVGFLGSYLFLLAFRHEFGSARESRFLAAALFFFPSLAFWTSLLGKDSWVYLCLGVAAYTVGRMLRGVRLRHLAEFLVSVVVIGTFRPEIGGALVVATGVAFLVRPMPRAEPGAPREMLRPLRVLIALLIIAGAATAVATTVVIDNLLTAAVNKHIGLSTDPTAGGSSLPVQITTPELGEVVRFLPTGMFTALFRPLVFEAHNVAALVAALDATLLLALVLWRIRYLGNTIRAMVRRPFLVFCGTLVVLFTAALAFEANFGVLVRHRTMALPFLFILLAVPPKQRGPILSRGNPALQNLVPGRE